MPDPQPLELVGVYVHEGSGLSFPEAAAGFQRVVPKRYDVEGNDVSIGYRRTWTDGAALWRAEVTIFVFPRYFKRDGSPMPPEEQFEGEVAALRKGKAEVREVRRVEAPGTCAGRAVAVKTAEFEFRGGPEMGGQLLATLLTGMAIDPWRVTYRVTVPAIRRDDALAGVDELLDALSLPRLGVPTAASAPGR